MAETQTENLQLELTDGDSKFDTDKVKRNFEKIDTAIAEQNKNFAELNENLTWQYLCTLKNNSKTYLYPDNAKELHIYLLIISNDNLYFYEEKIISLNFAKNETFYTNVGSKRWASAGIKIDKSQKNISVFDCNLDDVGVTNYTIDVYYR